ncbi:MAG: GDP-mannose 4,6-dehydratase [Euryarchaeota archaeon]|nr:GDP-mannose 4,6-dehydratase [Euryarchaeota archaeon]
MKDLWKDKNVFVTGCTGLLGSHLTQMLVEKKANVIGLVRDSVPKSNLKQTGVYDTINIVRGSVEDFYTMERTINEYEIHTIFHLAAQTIVGTANRNPLSTFESNIKGTWCVLEACRRVPTVKKILVASSDKAYGSQEKLPYNEEAPLMGEHPYDASKSCADLLALMYYKTYQLPVCATRCGNFYGPGDLNFNRIVPGTIRSVLNNQTPVIRSDGSNIRDYFYVKDGALSYLHLAEKMNDPNIHGEAFNFSNEQQISVLEITNNILKLMKREDLQPKILNQATNEIKHQYLSAKKAREQLKWRPKYTLDKGLRETIEWYTKFLKR